MLRVGATLVEEGCAGGLCCGRNTKRHKPIMAMHVARSLPTNLQESGGPDAVAIASYARVAGLPLNPQAWTMAFKDILPRLRRNTPKTRGTIRC